MSRTIRRPVVLLASMAALVLLLVLSFPGVTSGTPAPKFTTVSVTGTAMDADLTQLIASCEAGYHVTGGGYQFASINPALFVHQEIPVEPEFNGGVWGWAVTALNETEVDVTFTVIALCGRD